ncbi:MAG: ABC transporter substrate binding protein [Sediminibacterium sp.]
MKIFFLNTKKESTREAVQKNVGRFLAEYKAFQPDAVIISDDDGMREAIVPYVLKDSVPLIFCGINWSASEYRLPNTTTTGILEVLPVLPLISSIRIFYPQLHTVTVLTENSIVEKKNAMYLGELFNSVSLVPTYKMVADFDSWKKEFVSANLDTDLIYLPTNGTIKNWNTEEAISFVRANIKKPVVTCDDFMMPYAVYGETKVAAEQGEWAIEKAIAILSGTSPSNIPVTQNVTSKRWWNKTLATKLGLHPDKQFLANLNFAK